MSERGQTHTSNQSIISISICGIKVVVIRGDTCSYDRTSAVIYGIDKNVFHNMCFTINTETNNW